MCPLRTSASEVLRRRYGRSEENSALQTERINAEIAHTIASLRQEAGLTQKQLADKIGTTQSVISRLEDADYEGHSLSMLNRIAEALGQTLKLKVESRHPDQQTVRLAFREVLRKLRLAHGFTIQKVAHQLDISESEALALERDESFRPSPLLLHKISKIYNVPQRGLAILCGAVKDMPTSVVEEASRFAAMSDSFNKLTPEERKDLDRFIKFLRSEL
jgi:transcriptional regulator with XRE-family HTH domain